MPYKVVKEREGYFVMDAKGHKFSKHPLSKKRAHKQEVAIVLSEARRKHIDPSKLFA